jgi:parallel beta-helix repeat protein
VEGVVNSAAAPGYFLRNVAEIWATVLSPNGHTPVERLIATAYVDTPTCCWDTTGIIYVDRNAPAGGSGISWQLAYNDLQDALARARETTCTLDYVIYVAHGVYSAGEHADDSFVIPDGVNVYGGFPPGGCAFSQRSPTRYRPTLSGRIDATRRNNTVVVMGNNTYLDGFTISGSSRSGQGIYGFGADFAINNCNIVANEGYGLYTENCNVDLKWCNIRNNEADGVYHQGEGFTLTVANCWVRESGQNGIYCLNSIPIISNSILSESNMAREGRAGIRMFYPTDTPVLYNNTISHNKGVGISLAGSTLPEVQNCIVYYNNDGGPQLSGFKADDAAWFSCIQDCNSVNFNISAEPQLAYFDPNNIRISYASPCRDAGSPLLSYDGQSDMDGRDRVLGNYADMGAYEIDCEDVSNVLWDKNTDGIVNMAEFNRLAKVWLAHDPNDPGIVDPNHPDHTYLTDPNAPGYVTPASIAAWYPNGHTFNYVATGASQYRIDIADLLYWLDEAPWLWTACWRTDILPPEMMMAGGEMLRMVGAEPLLVETQTVPEKTVLEQMSELANTIAQLENLWLMEPDIQQTINPDNWNRFMEAVYQNLIELQTETVQ